MLHCIDWEVCVFMSKRNLMLLSSGHWLQPQKTLITRDKFIRLKTHVWHRLPAAVLYLALSVVLDLKLSRLEPSHFPVQPCVWGAAPCRIQTHLAAIAHISSLFTAYSFLQSPMWRESAVRILPYKCHPESFWFKTWMSLTPKQHHY